MGEEVIVNDRVWVPDDVELWVPAEVISVSADKSSITVIKTDDWNKSKTSSNKDVSKQLTVYPMDKVVSYDPDHGKDWDDVFQMADLNEPAFINVLKRRFQREKIYTFTGDILVSVNPYRRNESLYSTDPAAEQARGPNAPHVYSVARRAYDAMLNSSYKTVSQSILINGESGAGKNEAAKYMMRYLANLSQTKRAELKKAHFQNMGGGISLRPTVKGMNKFFQKIGNGNKSDDTSGNSTRALGTAAANVFAGGRRGRGRGRGLFSRASTTAIKQDEGDVESARTSTASSQRTPPETTRRSKSPSQRRSRHKSSKGDSDDESAEKERSMSQVERVLLLSNPLLEAFGNSRTAQNENSSRFGKFVRLEYNNDGVIEGGRTLYFLLEKSRIVKHSFGERNYHIFYQLCAGAQQDDSIGTTLRDKLRLGPADNFNYLRPSAVLSPDGLDLGARLNAADLSPEERNATNVPLSEDLHAFRLTCKAMEAVNISRTEQLQVWGALAAILYLGNVQFGAVRDNVRKDSVNMGEVHINSKSREAISTAALLLHISPELLMAQLTQRSVRAGNKGSLAIINLTMDQASESAAGLSKAIYQSIFDWLIGRINQATSLATTQQFSSLRMKPKNPLFIGILDIFGFEVFETNSFEQLCINYANEVLQRMFDLHVYNLEVSVYAEEGVEHDIKLRDSHQLIQLMDCKGTGMFQLLDEQGMLGSRGSDQAFLEKIHAKHAGKNQYYSRPKVNNRTRDADLQKFVIKHYAGPVTYSVRWMVEKNSDALQPDLEKLIMSVECGNSFVQGAFRRSRESSASDGGGSDTRSGKKNRRGTLNTLAGRVQRAAGRQRMAKLETVSHKFRNQMYALEHMLSGTTLHFVRCIKPNLEQRAFDWDSDKVIKQLNMLGSLEMVRIRREGFPIQSPFSTILEKYWELAPTQPAGSANGPKHHAAPIVWKKGVNDKVACAYLLTEVVPSSVGRAKSSKGSGWKLGKTKCFLREHVLNFLDFTLRRKREEGATAKQILERKRAALRLQKLRHKGATRIGAWARGTVARHRYARTRASIIALQAEIRCWEHREKYRKLQTNAVVIQAQIRGLQERSRLARAKKIVRLQAKFRGDQVRRRFDKALSVRNQWKEFLGEGEVVIFAGLVWKYKGAVNTGITPSSLALSKRRYLILTGGRFHRILLVKKSRGKRFGQLILTGVLQWTRGVTTVQVKSSKDFVIFTSPSGKRGKVLYTFKDPAGKALQWALRLQRPYTLSDMLITDVPMGEEMKIVHAGTLKKRGLKKSKKWRERHFVLHGNVLHWSHTRNGPVSGAISLGRSATVTLPTRHLTLRRFCFDIHSPILTDSFRLQAPNRKNLEGWFRALGQVIDDSKSGFKAFERRMSTRTDIVPPQEIIEEEEDTTYSSDEGVNDSANVDEHEE